ncbi:MAG: prenyltransferase/squalene oxidase repeat-containing protein [Patescibacteria group bacterium]
MSDRGNLDHAILKSIKFITEQQNPDGSFNSYSHKESNPAKTESFVTIFYTSLILYSISQIKNSKLSKIKDTACNFLLSEKNKDGTYNYWAKSFSKYKTESCPNDLDDTSCALSALFACDQNLIKEDALAQITQVLINSEYEEGGPYFTWIVPKNADSKWKDIDLAVNTNIGLFLSMLGITLPNIEKLIENAIEKEEFSSTYYPNYSTLYFISRFYKGKLKEKLIQFIQKENSKPFKNSLECVLLGISLLNLEEEQAKVQNNIDYLLKNQQKNGSFGSHVFIIERSYKKDKRLSGSEAFTAILAIELMTKYQEPKIDKKSVIKYDKFSNLKNLVANHASELIKSRFKDDLADQFNIFLKKIISSDHDGQIIIHPYLFINSLKKRTFLFKENEKVLLDTAVAGMFGWLSYTIFDNNIDEKKDLDKLPLAIICNRELEELFCKNNPDFKPIFRMLIDRVDYANFYEFKYARLDNKSNYSLEKIYPNVEFIAEKSIAHCLGPLSIMTKLGFSPESQEFKDLFSFYQNYLIARQLNDDAHDWEEDFTRGQINYAGEILLRDFKKINNRKADISKDLLELRKLFWDKTILEVCNIIKNKITEAKANLLSLSGILDQNYLKNKLDELERSAEKAIKERLKTKQFLNALDLD